MKCLTCNGNLRRSVPIKLQLLADVLNLVTLFAPGYNDPALECVRCGKKYVLHVPTLSKLLVSVIAIFPPFIIAVVLHEMQINFLIVSLSFVFSAASLAFLASKILMGIGRLTPVN